MSEGSVRRAFVKERVTHLFSRDFSYIAEVHLDRHIRSEEP